MNDANRSIFRVDVLQRYMQSREEPVFPRCISPPIFVCLWLLLGLLVTGGLVAWFAQMPMYASGLAVVVSWQGKNQSLRDDIVMIAFLPPENLSRLRVGQKVFLGIDKAGNRLSIPIVAVEPEISSPSLARERFALNPGAAQAITQPSAIAVAPFEPSLTSLPASAYVGSIYHVDVEVGSRRVASLLPLVGRFFGESR